MATFAQSEQARLRAEELYGLDPDVNGIGVTRVDGGFGVRINVERALPRLPTLIDGVPVVTRIVGRIEAWAS